MWQRIKHFFTGCSHKNKKIIDEVRERCDAFSQHFLEVRTRHSAMREGDAFTVAPDRWYHTTLEQFETEFARSLSSNEVETVSDKSWGLFEQVKRVFAKDGKQLTHEDIALMYALMHPGEDRAVVTLATLFERHQASLDAHERIARNTMKVKGR